MWFLLGGSLGTCDRLRCFIVGIPYTIILHIHSRHLDEFGYFVFVKLRFWIQMRQVVCDV